MTPAGIEPATFRFVAQHLKHCATAVLNEMYNLTLQRDKALSNYLETGRRLKKRCFCVFSSLSFVTQKINMHMEYL